MQEAIEFLVPDTRKRVFKNMETRLHFVIRENGGHFEYVMN